MSPSNFKPKIGSSYYFPTAEVQPPATTPVSPKHQIKEESVDLSPFEITVQDLTTTNSERRNSEVSLLSQMESEQVKRLKRELMERDKLLNRQKETIRLA